FDVKRARKKLRHYVESNDHAIRVKAEIMVDHFHEQVIALNKIGGEARAMVVCSSIERALQYFHAISAYLLERKSPYRAIVAFAPYYRTTILSEETDPNKLHDLKADIEGYEVYDQAQVDQFVALYLSGADREQLDIILDACVATYVEALDEDGQVDFKGKCKA